MTFADFLPGVLAFLLGAALGSFANVVIYRVPLKRSVVNPPSACPGCAHQISARDNVPILGWLILRGKCRHCGTRISLRYPFVELALAVAFVLIVVLAEPRYWPILLPFAFVSVVLALIDLDTRKLPNALTYPTFAYLVVAVAATGVISADVSGIWRSYLAAAGLFLFYAIVWFVYPKGMGLGDVKLAPSLGLVLGLFGWGAVVVGAFLGFFVGSIVGVVAMIRAGKARKVAIPFGPSMIAGCWLGILVGTPIWNGYLELVGLSS